MPHRIGPASEVPIPDVPIPEDPIRSEPCTAPGYTVVIWRYLQGQYRIQLWRGPDDPPEICRELCTYNQAKADEVADLLRDAPDPEAWCEALARPWNCEGPGGRIRLDNVEGDR